MSYADPQSLTINGSAYSLPRIGAGVDSGSFLSGDSLVGLSIRHRRLSGGRLLHQAQASQQILAAAPLDPTVNVLNKMTATLSVNVPGPGYITPAVQKYLVDAFTTWLTASSGAKVTQLLGGES